MYNVDDFVLKSPVSLLSYKPKSVNETLNTCDKENVPKAKQLEEIKNFNNERFNSNLISNDLTLQMSNRATIQKSPIKSKKTVAFGITQINNANEKFRPSSPVKKISALRRANLFTAPAKDIEAVQKMLSECTDSWKKIQGKISHRILDNSALIMLKSQKEEMEKVKAENAQLCKALKDAQYNIANLTRIVTTISSRVMKLENDKHNCSKMSLEPEQNATAEAQNFIFDSQAPSSSCGAKGDSKFCSLPKKKDVMTFSRPANAQIQVKDKFEASYKKNSSNHRSASSTNHFSKTRAHSRLADDNKCINVEENSNNSLNLQFALQPVLNSSSVDYAAQKYQQKKLENSVGRRLLEECGSTKILNVERKDNDGEMQKLLFIIENRIRREPEMLKQVKELFGNSALGLRQNSVTHSDQNISSKANSLMSENFSGVVKCPMMSGSPYNAKYTQRMTVERSEVITYSSPNRNTASGSKLPGIALSSGKSSMSNPVSHNQSNRMLRPVSKEADDEFFNQIQCEVSYNDAENDNDHCFVYDESCAENEVDNHHYHNGVGYYNNQKDRFLSQSPVIKEIPVHNQYNIVQEQNQTHNTDQTLSRRERRERYRKR